MIPESFDLSFIASIFPKLIEALPVTLFITVLSMAAGCLVGLLLTFGKLSRIRLIRVIVNNLTVVLRGIPTIVLLYLVFFGLQPLIYQIGGIDISGWPKQVFVMIALSIELSVTCSEMFRSAYNSIDKGQLEAAHAIGMTRIQSFLRIILPQGLYVILPNLNNASLFLVQGTALAYTLGIIDVMGKANMLNTNAFGLKTFESYLAVALIYWAISIIIGWIFRLLERLFGRGQRTVGTVAR